MEKNVNLHYLDDKIFSGVRFNKICQKQINKKKFEQELENKEFIDCCFRVVAFVFVQ